jgi:hypothetical protein
MFGVPVDSGTLSNMVFIMERTKFMIFGYIDDYK